MKVVKGRPRVKKKVSPVPNPSSYVLEPLDPWLMCGPDTTVTELWKVRERRDKEIHIHLVYFDRYGWYCEHGRGCAAVAEVRRVVREIGTASAPSRKPVKARRKKRG